MAEISSIDLDSSYYDIAQLDLVHTCRKVFLAVTLITGWLGLVALNIVRKEAIPNDFIIPIFSGWLLPPPSCFGGGIPADFDKQFPNHRRLIWEFRGE